MKTLVKLLIIAVAIPVAIVAIIKFVRQCSWKDAVGIAEELWQECKNKCACCADEEEPAPEK